MNASEDICPISRRRYEEIPIDKVKVINSRSRDQDQFEMNVTSIDSVGLLKPIRVNDKFLESSGTYELICGEGRLLAHRQLGREKVLAEVVTCTRKEALLQSLVEKPHKLQCMRTRKTEHILEERLLQGTEFKGCFRVVHTPNSRAAFSLFSPAASWVAPLVGVYLTPTHR